MAKDNVRIIRLTTGEEVICKAEDASSLEGKGWLIKDALLLVPVNLQNLSMIPWLAYADIPEEGLHIPEKIIAFTVIPQKRLKAEYDKAFSKILTPDLGDVASASDFASISNKLRLSTE